MDPGPIRDPIEFIIVYQQMRQFELARDELEITERPEGIQPELWQIQKNSLDSVIVQWKEELNRYASEVRPVRPADTV